MTKSQLCVHRGGGGAVLPYKKLYWNVPPDLVWFLRHFRPRKGIDFAHFALESGIVFEETTRVYKRICLFNSK